MQLGLRIRNQKDLAAGLVYIAAGAAFAIGAFNYKVGEAARMGPGYFPLSVGILLFIVGVLTAFSSLSRKASVETLKVPDLRTIAWILGAVVLFGLLLQPLGLVLALAVLVVVSSLGSHEFTWKGALLNAVVLIAFSLAVFIWGIDLLLPIWPSFMR